MKKIDDEHNKTAHCGYLSNMISDSNAKTISETIRNFIRISLPGAGMTRRRNVIAKVLRMNVHAGPGNLAKVFLLLYYVTKAVKSGGI